MGGKFGVLKPMLSIKSNLAGIVATSPYIKLSLQPPNGKLALGRPC